MANQIITKEAIQELQVALTPVVEKLGQGGEWAFKVYRRQVFVDAITNYGGWLAFWSLLIFFLIKSKKRFWDKLDEGGTIIYWALWITVVLNIFISGTQMTARFINPDYYVIQDLLSIIKPQK